MRMNLNFLKEKVIRDFAWEQLEKGICQAAFVPVIDAYRQKKVVTFGSAAVSDQPALFKKRAARILPNKKIKKESSAM